MSTSLFIDVFSVSFLAFAFAALGTEFCLSFFSTSSRASLGAFSPGFFVCCSRVSSSLSLLALFASWTMPSFFLRAWAPIAELAAALPTSPGCVSWESGGTWESCNGSTGMAMGACSEVTLRLLTSGPAASFFTSKVRPVSPSWFCKSCTQRYRRTHLLISYP